MLLGNYMMVIFGAVLSVSSLVLSWPELQSSYDQDCLIQKYENQTVSVSGFLYHKDERVFLCAEPGLRTCCVGKKEKLNSQILLEISQETPHSLGQLVTVSGTYHALSKKDEMGKDLQYLVLNNAVLLEKDSNSFLYGSLVFGTVCSVLVLAVRYISKL